jgi:long-chain acyl-CoA synthetase
VEADCPDLEWVVHLESRGVRDYDHPKLMSFRGLPRARSRAHRSQDPDLLARMAQDAEEDDVVTLIYTSGHDRAAEGCDADEP